MMGPVFFGKLQAEVLPEQIAHGEGRAPASPSQLLKINKEIFADETKGDSLLERNEQILKQADEFSEKGDFKIALKTFQRAIYKSELVTFQKNRITTLELLYTNDEPASPSLLAARNMLAALEADKNYDFRIQLRLGKTFQSLSKWEEASIALTEAWKGTDIKEDQATSLFNLILVESKRGNLTDSCQLSVQFLQDFPEAPQAEEVLANLGELYLRDRKLEEAEKSFGLAYEGNPRGPKAHDLLFSRAAVRFDLGKFEDARVDFTEYLKLFPQESHSEAAFYRMALCFYEDNAPNQAIDLLDKYLSQFHREGTFTVDAYYRLNQLRLTQALEETEPAKQETALRSILAQLAEVLDQHKDSSALALIHFLQGDTHKALKQRDEAVSSFRNAVLTAQNSELITRAADELPKLLDQPAQAEDLSKLWEEFILADPVHPLVPLFASRLGKSRTRQGVPGKAAFFLAEIVRPQLDDADNETVDQLITQMVSLLPASVGDPGTYLAGPRTSFTGTAYGRVVYARAEAFRLAKDEAKSAGLIRQVGSNCKADDLSPLLLGRVGERLRLDGKLPEASVFFQTLVTRHEGSDQLDLGFTGLGEIAFAADHWEEALAYFTLAMEASPEGRKSKEAHLGKARCLSRLKRFEEADLLLEKIITTKEWRGEATAESLFLMAENAYAQENWPRAHSFYQRIYISWQKYPSWVAKSYMKAADVLQKLGKTEEVKATLKDLLRQKKLWSTPEAEEARKRLGLDLPKNP